MTPLDKFVHTKKHIPKLLVPLFLRKQCYPYQFATDFSKYFSTTFPRRKDFRDDLNKREEVDEDDYNYAHLVWNAFNVKNFKNLTLLYVLAETLALADIFQELRREFHSKYRLDPAWNLCLAGYSFQAMLYETGMQIELITDINMQLIPLLGTRSGYSIVNQKFVAARNWYLGDELENGEESVQLIQLDQNNLYAGVLCDKLPSGNYRFLTTSQLENFQIMNSSDDDEKGYVFVADISYKPETHDYFDSYPPLTNMEYPPRSKIKKLLATFHDKKNYLIHIKMLRQIVPFGLNVDKLQVGFEFY